MSGTHARVHECKQTGTKRGGEGARWNYQKMTHKVSKFECVSWGKQTGTAMSGLGDGENMSTWAGSKEKSRHAKHTTGDMRGDAR